MLGKATTSAKRMPPAGRFSAISAGWIHSCGLRETGAIEVDGVETGRINARLLADGRIEFALTFTDGDRILPQFRYFPVGAGVGRWRAARRLSWAGRA